MKTLHLTNAWHKSSGGISTFYRALLRRANDRKRLVRLVVPADESRMEEWGEWGRVYYIKSGKAPLDATYNMFLPQQFLVPGSSIHRIIDEERPELVEICDKYVLPYLSGCLRIGWLPKLRHRPAVVGLSCERMDENMAVYLTHGRLGKWFCQWYMKWIYFPELDHHIAVTEHTADELRTASKGHKVQRGVWIAPMGADAETFTPDLKAEEVRRKLLARFGGDENTLLLLYAGRLAPEKNLALLLETAKRLSTENGRDYRLLVAGSGPLREAWEAHSRNGMKGRLHLLGHIDDRQELAKIYANCDAFVHPNPREPFGIAPLEAMAAGIALVGPLTGGVRTYATPENAWLAEDNAEAYTEAVRQATTPGEDRERRMAEARSTAERYSLTRVCDDYFGIYDDIAGLTLAGTEPQRKPDFYSTLGDMWGKEIPENPAGATYSAAHPIPPSQSHAKETQRI